MLDDLEFGARMVVSSSHGASGGMRGRASRTGLNAAGAGGTKVKAGEGGTKIKAGVGGTSSSSGERGTLNHPHFYRGIETK